MMQYKQIAPKDMDRSVFEMIGEDWMLITAKKGDKVNTMTASWGGMGVLWGSDVVFIFVRKSRYTKEFIDGAEEFSISFFTPEHKEDLSYLGKVSGRDEDKISKVGFHVTAQGGIPFFEEAEKSILCKKVGKFAINPEGILDEKLLQRWYADKDYHDLYIGKIEQIIQKVER